jgi:hypothetical protein
MSFFKNRAVAWIIFIAVTVVSVFFGFSRSFQRASNKVTDLFYDGIYDEEENYTVPSIDSQLTNRYQAATGMVATCSAYSSLNSLTDELRNAKNALYDAETLGDKYKANQVLETAYTALYSAFKDIQANGKDVEAMDTYASTMSGAQSVINSSEYNEKVDEFMQKDWQSFPANILRNFAGTSAPEYFK